MPELDEERLVDEIYDALDRGDAEQALEMAGRAMEQLGEDPVLRFLAGRACLDLGEVPAAVEELRRAVEMDPDDAEFRSSFAYALFRACRFADAEDAARRSLEADPDMPEAHEVLASLLERRGRTGDAETHRAQAARVDPEGYPLPVRFSREEFEKEVLAAERRLPEEFRTHLEDVAVSVEDVPSDEILLAEEPPLDPELLGLFVGLPLGERTHSGPGGELPPRILLFQRNIERVVGGRDELRDEIAITLYHELGHYLGLDEDELEKIDLG